MHRLLLVALAVLVSSGSKMTIRIPLVPSEEIAVVTFDQSKTSAENIRKWMKLDEHGYYSAPVIRFYSGCTHDTIAEMHDDVMKTRRIIDELNPNNFPPDLSAVVTYLKGVQSLWLWQTEQQLKFVRDGDLPDTEYNGVDLHRCQTSVQNQTDTCHAVLFTWHNCVLDATRDSFGEYPKPQWKAFLDANGIQERVESTITN